MTTLNDIVNEDTEYFMKFSTKKKKKKTMIAIYFQLESTYLDESCVFDVVN